MYIVTEGLLIYQLEFNAQPFSIVTSQLVVVGWLPNVPATGECISGTDLLRQFHVLLH